MQVLIFVAIIVTLSAYPWSIKIYVSYNYNYGFTDIMKEYNQKNSVFQFTLGYKFKL